MYRGELCLTDQEESDDASLMKILGALKKPKEPEKPDKQEKHAETEPGTAGLSSVDLSDLIKKINESAQEPLQPPQGIPPQSALQEQESIKQERTPPLSPDVPFSAGTPPPSDSKKSVGTTGSVPVMSAQDVRESLGKIMAEIGSKEPLPEEKPSPSSSVEFDIFDEPVNNFNIADSVLERQDLCVCADQGFGLQHRLFCMKALYTDNK
jgi:hypothetical protein